MFDDYGNAMSRNWSLQVRRWRLHKTKLESLHFWSWRLQCLPGSLFQVLVYALVAENDAGGITTYTATGAQYGTHLLWFLVILGPVAYFV